MSDDSKKKANDADLSNDDQLYEIELFIFKNKS